MNHDKATEKYFRLRGWEQLDDYGTWFSPDFKATKVCVYNLPNICESMTDWIKYVQKEMPNKGQFSILAGYWYWWLDSENGNINTYEEIKDHEILLASVRAACDYLEAKAK
jgi:hypothetical protein